MEGAEVWILTMDSASPHEFYKSHLMIETKIIIPSNAQDNIYKWRNSRNLNGTEISFHLKW